MHVADCRTSLSRWACLTASNRQSAQHDNGGVCAVELPRLASQGAGVFEGQARTRPASWRSRRTFCCCIMPFCLGSNQPLLSKTCSTCADEVVLSCAKLCWLAGQQDMSHLRTYLESLGLKQSAVSSAMAFASYVIKREFPANNALALERKCSINQVILKLLRLRHADVQTYRHEARA